MHRIVEEYVDYFNRARPRQGIAQKVSGRIESKRAGPRQGRFVALPFLHGLHHAYRRAA